MIRKTLNILFILFILLGSACQTQQEHKSKSTLPTNAKIEMTVPSSFNLDEALKVELALSQIPNSTHCQLVVSSKFTEQIYPIDVSKNKNSILVKAFNQAGNIWLGCFCDGNLMQTSSSFLKPGKGKDKMEAFNGPKSLLSYDDVSSMLVVIPKDKYNNPVASGTAVTFAKQYPNQINISNTANTKNLVAHKITESIGKSGKILLGASSDQAFMSEQEILIQATLPQKILIETIEVHPNADSRQNIQIATLPILDINGNPVSDGTKINFIVLDQIGKRAQYDSFTINGIAKVLIQNPSKASRWQIVATLYGSVFSNKLNYNFASFIQNYNLNYDKAENILKAGPLSTTLGQLAPDGTLGKLNYKNENNVDTLLFSESLDGYIIFKLNQASINEKVIFRTEIGGIKNRLELD